MRPVAGCNCQKKWEHRLDAWYAARCFEGLTGSLFLQCMRSMIGGDAIDGTVFYPFPERFQVLTGPQRRVHFGERPKGTVIVGCEEEVMRCDFAGDTKAPLLRTPYEIDSLCG